MTYRVLSINGGGMRGLYAAAYLEALEKGFMYRRGINNGLDIGKAFDLIVGTSTGSIIACGLASGIGSSEISKLYRTHGHSIFPKKMPNKPGLDLLFQLYTRPKYLEQGSIALKTVLNSTFKDQTIGSIWTNRKIALAIPAVKMSNSKPWVFKTPHNPKSDGRDNGYTLTEVCLASSAAPLFRSLEAINEPKGEGFDVFADGGLWANNPVMVAVTEACRIVGDSAQDIEIYCLGSCAQPDGKTIEKSEVNRSIQDWKFGGEVASLSIAVQECAFDEFSSMIIPHLKQSVKIVHFPTNKIPKNLIDYLDLDETSTKGMDALEDQARVDASLTNSLTEKNDKDGKLIEDLFNNMPERQ